MIRARSLPAAIATLGAVAILAGCGGSAKTSLSAAASRHAALDAPAVLSPPAQAPDFTLRDSLGKPVTLSQFRGRAVLLTFIYDHCPDVCPLIVANLHSALLKLGREASKVQIVAVSVDPRGDTPATVKAFLAKHEMTGRMEYLIGSFRQLEPVWRLYGVGVQATPDSREVDHSAFVYGITAGGKRVALYPSSLEPEWIVHDVPILASG